MVSHEAGIDTSHRPPAYEALGPQQSLHRWSSDEGTAENNNGPQGRHTREGYHAPSTATTRDSEESAAFLSATGSRRSSADEIQGEMAQMEICDDAVEGSGKRSMLRVRLSRRWADFTSRLSEIGRRIKASWPPFKWIRSRLTTLNLVAPVIGFVLLAAGTYFLLSMSFVLPKGNEPWDRRIDPELVRSYVQGHVNVDRIRGTLEWITSFDHVAGTRGGYALAKYVQGHFQAADLEEVEMRE